MTAPTDHGKVMRAQGYDKGAVRQRFFLHKELPGEHRKRRRGARLGSANERHSACVIALGKYATGLMSKHLAQLKALLDEALG